MRSRSTPCPSRLGVFVIIELIIAGFRKSNFNLQILEPIVVSLTSQALFDVSPAALEHRRKARVLYWHAVSLAVPLSSLAYQLTTALSTNRRYVPLTLCPVGDIYKCGKR